MNFPDKTGSRVPLVSFKIRDDYQWLTKDSNDLFKGKRVILFALPGAFTPTCSSVHLPGYNDLYDSFRANGIDDVICLSVNDSFVLNEWKKHEKAWNITMLPDGNGEFSEQLGFLVDKKDLCFGKRSWRYSMVIQDGVIEKMFLEPEQGDDPYGESSAESMLKYLNPEAKLPDSITVYTRSGCKYCAYAKQLLRENDLLFEEHVLNQDYTIKTLKALSGGTMVPQIFINGERVGGSSELEAYLSGNGFIEKKKITDHGQYIS